jgi:DNA topoisomerase-1
VNHAWFRVGTERHTRKSRTHGITTLTKKHVTISGDEIAFRFHTKNRRLVSRKVQNAALARELRALVDLDGGSRLFRYERDGETFNLTAPVLNDYIGEHLGDDFTAKDFRTWGGTLLAAVELGRHGPATGEGEAKRVLGAVMTKVARELGNTPAVARSSYVSPAVVDHYLEGRTIEDFRRAGSRPPRLTADERALLRMLRSRGR